MKTAGLLIAAAISGHAQPFDHSAWDRVLRTCVNAAGEVDYARLKSTPADLNEYVRALRESSPRNRPAMFPTRNAELAYWINAYNAFITEGVVRAYPTSGVLKIGLIPFRFFTTKDYTAGGRRMSLKFLEDEIIRAKYKEPRIHFAIVCASLSCPKLAPRAYTEENLEQMLEAQTRQFFAERRNLEIAGDRVIVSKLLDWYKGDFPPILELLNRYAPEPRRRALQAIRAPRVEYRGYDWSINDPGSRARAKSAVERELALP
ncbi:MAG: DUF547 domain-containing protein [Bryobacteraceae bacterium]|nr:DUF547 domain-containing protein [Bryobacteraceae bacterium]